MAAHEAAQTSKRRKAKLRHDAESGRPHWARRPFGFELTGEHVPAEADMLREIYARIIDGESATAVARWLNESEVPTASGAEWQAATVTFLVQAERNAGKRAYKGEIVGDGSWQPIVDEQTWRDGCAALAARSRPKKGGSVSLLTGLVECGACGGTVYRTGAGRRAEYRCIHRQDGRKVSGCGNSMIAYRVDEHLTGLVLAFVGDVEPKSNQRRSTDAPADVVQMRAEVDELAAMFGRDARRPLAGSRRRTAEPDRVDRDREGHDRCVDSATARPRPYRCGLAGLEGRRPGWWQQAACHGAGVDKFTAPESQKMNARHIEDLRTEFCATSGTCLRAALAEERQERQVGPVRLGLPATSWRALRELLDAEGIEATDTTRTELVASLAVAGVLRFPRAGASGTRDRRAVLSAAA